MSIGHCWDRQVLRRDVGWMKALRSLFGCGQSLGCERGCVGDTCWEMCVGTSYWDATIRTRHGWVKWPVAILWVQVAVEVGMQ